MNLLKNLSLVIAMIACSKVMAARCFETVDGIIDDADTTKIYKIDGEYCQSYKLREYFRAELIADLEDVDLTDLNIEVEYTDLFIAAEAFKLFRSDDYAETRRKLGLWMSLNGIEELRGTNHIRIYNRFITIDLKDNFRARNPNLEYNLSKIFPMLKVKYELDQYLGTKVSFSDHLTIEEIEELIELKNETFRSFLSVIGNIHSVHFSTNVRNGDYRIDTILRHNELVIEYDSPRIRN